MSISFSFHTFFLLICSIVVDTTIIAVHRHKLDERFADIELFMMDAIEGAVVKADPINACSNISLPPFHDINQSLNWFVLISEGDCSLDEKINNAGGARYSAAIIFHVDIPSVTLTKQLTGSIPYQNITVVFISADAAERIMNKYLFGVNPESRLIIYPNRMFNIFTFFVLFAVMAAIFICTVFLFLMIRCIQQNRQRRRNRLSTRHLKQIPTTRYRPGDPYETCAICLDDYKEKDRLRILPCSHGYHCKCIDPWLTNNRRNCPVCKQKVALPGVHSDEDSSSDTESRAEATPLIRDTVRRPVSHGTFNNQYISNNVHSSFNGVRTGSGESTSGDVPSDALDETSDEERQIVTMRPCISAPGVLASLCEDISETPELLSSNADQDEQKIFTVNVDSFSVVHQNPSTSGSAVNTSSAKLKSQNTVKPYVV